MDPLFFYFFIFLLPSRRSVHYPFLATPEKKRKEDKQEEEQSSYLFEQASPPFFMSTQATYSILGGLLDRPGVNFLPCGLALRHRFFSPSCRNHSMICNSSFRPLAAFTSFPARLMLTVCLADKVNSRFKSKWRICRQTKTPQSELLFCCGLSTMSLNFICFPSSFPSRTDATSASRLLWGYRES